MAFTNQTNPPPVVALTKTPTGVLMQDFRDSCIRLGRDPEDKATLRRVDTLEEELMRRTSF